MPPKNRKRAGTPPSTGKKKAKHSNGQPPIDAFFTSPSKKRQGNDSVISISDDEDDLAPSDKVEESKKMRKNKNGQLLPGPKASKASNKQIAKDEILARDLSRQWTTEEETTKAEKGKGRAPSQTLPLDDEEDGGIEVIEVPASESPRINGSSSSSHKLPTQQGSPARPSKPRLNKGTDANVPLAPVFSGLKTETSPDKEDLVKDEPDGEPPKLESGMGDGDASSPIRELEEFKPDVKPLFPLLKPKGEANGAITSTFTEAVEPIDFDVDGFTFRPEEVDVSKWPKGRLPYSVLVGVYVQVSSTRSRLLIVRVLTK